MKRPDLTHLEEEQLNDEQPLNKYEFATWLSSTLFEWIDEIEECEAKTGFEGESTIRIELQNGQTFVLNVQESSELEIE